MLSVLPFSIQNPSPVPRRPSWVKLVVPAAHVQAGKPSVHEYPDWEVSWGRKCGLNRFIYVRPTRRIEAAEKVQATLVFESPVEGDVPPSDEEGPSGAASLGVSLPVVKMGVPSPLLKLVVIKKNGDEVVFPLTTFKVLSNCHASTELHLQARIPETLWVVNLWVDLDHGSIAPRFELLMTAQNPFKPAVIEEWHELRLEGVQVVPLVDELLAKNGRPHGPMSVTLNRAWWIADAQSLSFFGRLLLLDALDGVDNDSPVAEQFGPLIGMLDNSSWLGHWGPWGVTPGTHPALDTKRAFKAEYDKWTQSYNAVGTPFWNGLVRGGLNDTPSGTGAQGDFGVTKLMRAFIDGGNPIWLLMLQSMVAREAGRPSMFHEANGDPLDLDNHPELVTWGCYPHWSKSVSPDQLKLVERARPNTLWVYAFSHISINALAGWTILTGSRLGEHVLKQLLTLILASTENLGEERAWGRTPLAVAWIWKATGDPRCREFANRVFNSDFRWNPMLEARDRGEPVCVSHVHDPNGQPYWQPWQVGLEVAGLDALALCFPGDSWEGRAHEIIETLCTTLVNEGFSFWRGRWTVGKWHEYLAGGESLPEDHYDRRPELSYPHWDPDNPRASTAFDRWCHAAVRICMRRARGDTAERAEDINLALTSEWLMAEPVEFDAFTEWASVL